MIGDKNAKWPLVMPRAQYIARIVARKGHTDAEKIAHDQVDAEDVYEEAGDKIHNVLSVALRNCAAARTILGKYVAGLPVDGKPNEVTIFADGKGAWEELRDTAMGGRGIETAEGYLQEMYRLQDVAINVDDLLIEHDALVQKIMLVPDMSLDKVYKIHFLRCLKSYPEYDVVEHSCATDPNKTYNDTVRDVKSRLNRLKAGNPTEVGAAFNAEDSHLE